MYKVTSQIYTELCKIYTLDSVGGDPVCLSAHVQGILAVWTGWAGLAVGRLLTVLDTGIDPPAPCAGI